MPQFLREDAIRLLEASSECLQLSMLALGVPRRHEYRYSPAPSVPAVALAGVSAELAMSACLVQVFGRDATLKTESQYKSGREILSDFRSLLRAPVPRASFLIAGIEHPDVHRELLLRTTEGFTVLITQRAAALHNGIAPQRDVCAHAVTLVSRFLLTLGESSRIRPYLQHVPELPEPPRTANLLVGDLVKCLRDTEDLSTQAAVLSDLFLVLPELPPAQPSWIDAFRRVQISPERDDVSLLVTAVENALPVELRRTTPGGMGHPVRVEPKNTSAIPIAPYHLKRSLTGLSDRCDAETALCNGALDQGRLQVPDEEIILDLVVAGPDGIRETFGRDTLTAHEVWPFVVGALLKQGTPLPFWFVIRLCSDVGQLQAQCIKALDLSHTQTAKARKREFEQEISSLVQRDALTRPVGPVGSPTLESAEDGREALTDAVQRNHGTDRELPAAIAATLITAARGEGRVSEALDRILAADADIPATSREYWARTLAAVAVEWEDRTTLVEIIRRKELASARTSARKSLTLIDRVTYGPPTHS